MKGFSGALKDPKKQIQSVQNGLSGFMPRSCAYYSRERKLLSKNFVSTNIKRAD